jgi:hypothetical protein
MREFYMGHWFWLFLLKSDVPYPVYGLRSIYPFRWLPLSENTITFNRHQAFEWLTRTQMLAQRSRYNLRLTLSELHLGDYWYLTSNDSMQAESHWRAAMSLSVKHQLPHFQSQATARLEQKIDIRDVYGYVA